METKSKRNKEFISINDFEKIVLSQDGLSTFLEHKTGLIHLAYILKDCSTCRVLSSNNPGFPCSGSGCYLEKMGFDMNSLSAPNGVAILSGICNELVGVISNAEAMKEIEKANESLSDSLSAREEELKKAKEELKQAESKLNQEKSEMAKDKKEVEDFKKKKSKLGRRSEYEGRRVLYETYYFGVEDKPTIEELTKIVKAKRSTVFEDLKKIKKEKGLI